MPDPIIAPNTDFENQLNASDFGKFGNGMDALASTQNVVKTTGQLNVNELEQSLLSQAKAVNGGAKTNPLIPGRISPFQVDNSGRLDRQLVGEDNEDYYAKMQGFWDKAANGMVKTLGLATSTFAQGTAGLVYGLGQVVTGHGFNSLYNNDVSNWLNDFSTNTLENALPNYYTARERNAKWYEGANLFTANFLFDKLIKNAGFSIGAIAAGGALTKVLRGVTAAIPMFNNAERAKDIIAGIDAAVQAAPDEQKAAVFSNLISKASHLSSSPQFAFGSSTAERALISTLGAATEGGIEALQGLNEFRNNKVKEYQDKYGYSPTGDDLEKINNTAEDLGNARFLMNMGLLSATNYIQLPHLLGTKYTTSRAIANTEAAELGEIGGVKLGANRALESTLPSSKAGKFLYGAHNVSALFFSGSEAFEEGAQYAIQKGVENYYNKAYRGEGASFVDEMANGVKSALNDKEGLESILLGGLSGGLQQAGFAGAYTNAEGKTRIGIGKGGRIGERGITGYGGEQAAATNAFISAANNAPLSLKSDAWLKAQKEATARGVNLLHEGEGYIRQGDVLEAKDNEHDQLHNYLAARIKFGRYDLVKDDIEFLKSTGANPKGLQDLKDQGYADPNDTVQSFGARVANFEQHAENINTLFNSLHLNYGGLTTTVDGNKVRKYSEETIDKMVYASSKIADYDNRIPQLAEDIQKYGIPVENGLNNIIENGSVKKEDTQAALDAINNLKQDSNGKTITSDVRDKLKSDFRDLIELGLRRGSYIDQFEAMKTNPSKFDKPVLPVRDGVLSIPQNEAKGTRYEDVELGKSYSLTDPIVRSGNSIIVAPKITPLNQTLAGEIETQLPTGDKTFIPLDSFRNFNLSAIGNENQKINDAFLAAFNKSIKKQKFSNLPGIENATIDSAQQYVKDQDNDALTTDIMAELDPAIKDIEKKMQAEQAAAQKLKTDQKLKDQIAKTQKHANVITSDIPPTDDQSAEDINDKDPYPKAPLPAFLSKEADYYDENNPKDHQKRRLSFLNNLAIIFGSEKANRVKAIAITKNNEEHFGLKGLHAYIVNDIKNSTNASQYFDEDGNIKSEEDPIIKLYTIQDGGKLFLSDINGNKLSELTGDVIQQAINSGVFGVFHSKIGSYTRGTAQGEANYSGGYTTEDEEQADKQLKAWRNYVLSLTDKSGVYDIEGVSRGVVLRDEQNKPVTSTQLARESDLTKDGIVVIPTIKGQINVNGVSLNMPIGQPLLQNGSNVDFLNNRVFTKKEAEGIHALLTQFANNIGNSTGDRIGQYLASVLYMKSSPSENSVYADADGNINFGTKLSVAFTSLSLDANKDAIVDYLSKYFVKTNNKTLALRNQKFEEPYVEANEVLFKQHDSYGQYLLSDKNGVPFLQTKARRSTDNNDPAIVSRYTTLKDNEFAFTPLSQPSDEEIVSQLAEETKPVETPGRTSAFKSSDIKKEEKIEPAKRPARRKATPEEAAEIEKKAQERLRAAEELRKKGDPRDELGEFKLAEEAFKPIDLEKEVAYIKAKSPFNVNILNDLLKTPGGLFAWGSYKDMAVNLYKNAQAGTGYHELFEGVWKVFTSLEDKQAILKEFNDRKGAFTFFDGEKRSSIPYNEATEQQMKETLADEFADFIQTGELPNVKSSKNIISQWFDKIVNFIKSIFNGKIATIDNLFKDIDSAKYKSAPYNSVTFKGQEEFSLTDVSYLQKYETVKGVALQVFSEMLNPKNKGSVSLTEFEESEIHTEEFYNRVLNRLDKIYNEWMPTHPDEFPENILHAYQSYWQNVKESWEDVKKLTNEYLNTFAIVESVLDDASRTRNDDYSNRDYVDDRKYFQNDAKNTASRSIKLLFATLPEAISSSISQVGIVSKRSNATFMQQQIQYSKNFNSLLYQISDVNSYYEKIARLKQLAKNVPNFKALLLRLEADSNTDNPDSKLNDWKLKIRWFNVFTKQMPQAYVQFNQPDGTSRTNSRDLGTATSATAQSWIDGLKARAINSTKGLTKQLDSGDLVLDTKELPTKRQYPQDRINFLNALGIEFNMDMYNKLNATQVKDFNKAVVSLMQTLGNSSLKPLDDLRALDAVGPLQSVAEAFIQAGNDYESMFYNINRERQARAVSTNKISRDVNDINNAVDLESLYLLHPELRQIKDSTYLNEVFFNKDGDRITDNRMKIGYVEGTMDSLGKPIPGENLSIKDRIVQEMNQNLNGRYYVLVPADAKTQWLLSLRNLTSFQDIANNANKWDDLLYDKMLEYYISEKADYESLVQRIGEEDAQKRSGIFREMSDNYKSTEAEFRQNIDDFISEKIGWQRRLLANSGAIVALKNKYFKWLNLDAEFLRSNNLKNGRLSLKDINNIITFRSVNWMVNNIEMHKMFFGSPLEYKDTKRYKLFLSPREVSFHGVEEFNRDMNEKYNTVSGVKLSPLTGFNNWSDDYRTVTMQDVLVGDDVLGKIAKAYNKTNSTDAQGISTIVAMRQRRMRGGNWQSKDDEQYEFSMARDRQMMLADGYLNKDNYPKELQDSDKQLTKKNNFFNRKNPSYFYVEKPIVSGHTTIDGEYFPVTDKFSIVSFSYAAIRNTNFRDHYVKMLKQDIGYLIMQSGRKVGARGADNFYNEDGTVNTDDYQNLINIPFSNYGVQTDTSGKKESQTRGTQITKLAIVNLHNNGIPITPRAGELAQHNISLLKELTSVGYQKLLKQLGAEDTGTGYKIQNKTKILNLIKQELLRRETPDSIKEQLQVVDGQLKTPFEALPNYQQIKNILYSHVDRNITSPKVNGGPKVQVSGALMEQHGFKRTKNGNVWTSAGLKFYTKDEPWMEVMLPFWAAKKLRQAGLKWNNEEELHQLFRNSPDSERLLSGVGFRIPTQELNSIEHIRIKGFLPEEMGDTVVVPEEITTKAGSDFDVDKLNMYLQNIYVDANKQIRVVPYFGTGDEGRSKLATWSSNDALKGIFNNDFVKQDGDALDKVDYLKEEEEAESPSEKLYHQSIENEYFKNIQDLLSLPENFERLVTPNTADDLKGIRDELVKLAPYEFSEGQTKSIIDPEYMLKTRHNGQSVKKLVGIAAISQTRTAVAQLSSVTMDTDKLKASRQFAWQADFIPGNKAILLPHNSIDGKPTISSIKDVEGRYITDKNSQYINGTVDVFNDAFLAQINFNRKTAGIYLMLEDIGVPNSKENPIVSLFMNQPIIRRYLQESDIKGINSMTNWDLIGTVKGLTEFRTTKSVFALPTKLSELKELLSSQISKYYKPGVSTITASDAAIQRLILDEFVKYAVYSSHLFRFQQGTDYDTTTINDTYSLKFKELQTRKAEDNIWGDAHEYMNNTFIGGQKVALEDATDVLSGVLHVENAITQKYLMPIIESISEKYLSADDKKVIARKLEESLFNYMIQTKTGMNNSLKSMLVDNTTALINELKAIKNKLKTSTDTNIINGNVILNQLIPFIRGRNSKNTKNITIAVKATDVFTKNLYNDSFKELYNNPLTHDLAEKLVTLSFLQNGISNSPISFKDALPADLYSNKINQIMDYLQDEDTLQSFIRTGTFYKNNTNDEDIVPNKTDGSYKTSAFEPLNRFVALLKSQGRLNDKVGNQGVLWMEAWRKDPYVSYTYDIAPEDGEPEYKTRLFKRVQDEYGIGVIKKVAVGEDIRDRSMYIPATKLGDDWRAEEHYESFSPSVFNNNYENPTYELDEQELANYLNNGTIPSSGTAPDGSVNPGSNDDIQTKLNGCL